SLDSFLHLTVTASDMPTTCARVTHGSRSCAGVAPRSLCRGSISLHAISHDLLDGRADPLVHEPRRASGHGLLDGLLGDVELSPDVCEADVQLVLGLGLLDLPPDVGRQKQVSPAVDDRHVSLPPRLE